MKVKPKCQVYSPTGRNKRDGYGVIVYEKHARATYENVSEIPPGLEEGRRSRSQNENHSLEASDPSQVHYQAA